MLTISKHEAEVIRERHPEVRIVRTMKRRSNRDGSYYCDETSAALNTLKELRGCDDVAGELL